MKPIQKLKQWAEDYDSNLRCDDPRFKRVVMLQHIDGTSLTFVKAFAVRYPMPEPFEHDFLVIFTEHHGWHWYDPEDLNAWYQFAGEYEPAETIEIEPRKDE